MKRYCFAQARLDDMSAISSDNSLIVECERKKGHKKKHKASWREGYGGKHIDIVVKWGGKK